MEIAIMSIAVVLNFIMIMKKAEYNRWADLFVDITVLVALSFLFAGTFQGMVVGFCASAIFSIYLWFKPPNLSKMFG